MFDVIVYQMGKVASTAVRQSIEARGLSAVQTHHLGEDILVSLMRDLMKRDIDMSDFNRRLEILERNIRLTRYVGRVLAGLEKKRPRFITMCRHPLDWLPRHVLQVHGFYATEIGRLTAQHGDAIHQAGTGNEFADFFLFLFDRMAQVDAPFDDRPAFDVEMKTVFDRFDGANRLMFIVHRILAPLDWFDKWMYKPFGLDVYSHNFDQQTGHGVITTEHADCLVLAYERVGNWPWLIGDFLGLDDFTMIHANISTRKGAHGQVAQAFDIIRSKTPAAFLDKLFVHKYCRHFGYTA